ncbi:MAG: hypothetical protein LBE32_05610 [Burkholderiales bacterium]|jgi:hypothetical protein|nr:hypothetical protein [Burkholderiales bacterium]
MGQSLTVDVGARTVSFEEGMYRASDVARRQMAAIGRSIDGVSGQLSSITNKFAAFNGALMGIGAGASFAGLIKSSIDAADNIDKLAEKTGIAHEALVGLSFSAKSSNTDIEGVAASAARLSRNMAAAAAGGSQQTAVFAAMGVEIKNTDGSLKSTDKILEELSDKFKSYSDGPEKAALAQQLFGKSGLSMIPMLNQGSAALAKQREEAQRYSGITKDVAQQASAFTDELTKINLIASGLGTNIAANLLPVMKGVSDGFVWLRDHSKEVNASLVGVGVMALSAALSSSKFAGALVTLTTNVKALTASMLANPFGLAAVAIGTAAASLYYFSDAQITVGKTSATVGDVISGVWIKTKETFSNAWVWIVNAVKSGEGVFGAFAQVVVDALDFIWRGIKGWVNFVISIFVGVGRTLGAVAANFVESFTSAFSRTKDLAVSLWDGIKKVFNGDFSFSSFSETFKKDSATVFDAAARGREAFIEAFETDYVGEFGKAVVGVAESFAIAGQEARKLKAEIAGDGGGGGKNGAPIVGGAGGAGGAGFAELIRGIDGQLAYIQAGYDAIYKTVKANAEREIDILTHTREMGLITESEFLQKRGALQQDSAEANVRRLQDTYAALSAALDQVLAAPVTSQEEANKRIEKATELQAKMVKVTNDLKEAQAAVGDTVRKTGQEEEKYYKAIAEQMLRINRASDDYLSSLKKRVDDLQFETSLIGKSAVAQAKLRAERDLRLEVDRKILEINREIADLEANGGDPAIIARRRQEIDEIKRGASEAIEAIRNSLDVQDWTKTFDQIYQSLSDAIMRGFEEGKSIAENFRDSLKNMFKTLVLRPVVQYVVQGGMGALGGLISVGANAAGMDTGGNSPLGGFLGFLGQGSGTGGINAGGVLSNVGTLFGGGGAMLAGGLASLTGALGMGGLSTGLGLAATGAGAMGGGMIGAFSSAGSMLFGGGASAAAAIGGTSAGIGAAVGSIMACVPYLAAIAAIVMVLVKIFGKKGGPKSGGFAVTENLLDEDIGRYYTPNNADEEAKETVNMIGQSWRSLAGSFGLDGKGIGFGFGFDSDPKGTAGNRTTGGVYVNGEAVYWNQEDWGRDNDKFQEGVALEIQRMMLAAARSVSDGDIRAVLGDFDIAEAAKEEIEQAFSDATYWRFNVEPMRAALSSTFGEIFSAPDIIDLQYAGESLEQTMSRLTNVFSGTNMAARLVGQSIDALFAEGFSGTEDRESMAARFGSADAMNSALAYYTQNFRAEDSAQWAMEDSSNALRSIFENIGAAVPRTRAEFDALVQGLDLTSSAAQETFMRLMNAAPAFNGLMGALEDMSRGMDNTIAGMRRSIEMGGLTQQETYNYLKREGDEAFAALQGATSIDDINKYFEQSVAAMSQSFGMMSDEEKRASRSSFLRQLDELETVKNERIEAARDLITGPADAIESAGKAVAQALANVAEQLGVSIDIEPFFAVSAAAETVTAALETAGVALTKPLVMDATDLDLAAADAMASVNVMLRETVPALDDANKRGIAAQEKVGEALTGGARDVKEAFGSAQQMISSLGAALSNIRIHVETSNREAQVGYAY